jgi:ABC-type sulfate transport system permease subunit
VWGPDVDLCFPVSPMVADLRDCYLYGSGTVFATERHLKYVKRPVCCV